mgnify:FL=1|tara:strand:- start:149 stop:868 length:720 start_codon:yes stop_codon:yes gene_type:complete
MSLLTIVQETLREIGGFEVPTSVVGNTNETAVLSLALVNRSLLETAKRTRWPNQTVRGTITTSDGTDQYVLPSDFKALINDSMWDDTNNRKVYGPIGPTEWEYLKNSDITESSLVTYMRIFKASSASNNRVFYLYPTPDGVATIRYEYMSNALAESSGGTAQAKFLADTDTGLLSEDTVALGFKWRILKSRGLPYAEEFRDYEAAVEDSVNDTGAPIINLGGPNQTSRFVFVTPEGSWE